MSRIIKKLSASIILILMLFSISFNVLDWGYQVYATGTGTETVTITSSKMKLIVNESTYELMEEEDWKTWLNKYDNYYTKLKSFTGVDPLSETGNEYITIDATSESIKSWAYYHTYENGWDCTIYIRPSIFNQDIENISSNINNNDSYTLIHELGHAFQYDYTQTGAIPEKWCFNVEVMTMLEAEYIETTYSINNLYYGNYGEISDLYSAYSNQLLDSNYEEYYWLASKLIEIRKNTGLTSFSKIISNQQDINAGYTFANYFNSFIDNWSDITGQDVWSQFTDEEMDRISTMLGGTIGTLKESEEDLIYYQRIINENGKTSWTEFSKEDTISIEGENEIILYIAIKGADISEKYLEISNKDIPGTYHDTDNCTHYGIPFTNNGTYELIIGGEKILTVTVNLTENTETKYLYVFNNWGSGSNTIENSDADKAQTDRDNVGNDLNLNDTEIKNWIISNTNKDIKYYCLDPGGDLKFDDGAYYYKYQSKELIPLDDEDILIMSFIQEVDESIAKDLNDGSLPANWRANALQYYIWSNVAQDNQKWTNYGDLAIFMSTITQNINGSNDYIDFTNETIKPKTDGKTYKITAYTALKYEGITKYYASDGNVESSLEEDEIQPLMTFDVKIEEADTQGIEILKEDQNGNSLEASFKIYKLNYNAQGEERWIELEEQSEYSTDSSTGSTGIIPIIEIGKYLIIETKTQDGYTPTTQYTIVTISGDGYTYEVYEANEGYNETGYVNLTSDTDGNIIDGTEINYEETEIDWNAGEWPEDGQVKLQLIVTNIKASIQIKKFDMSGNPINTSELETKGAFSILITDGNNVNVGGTEMSLNDNGEIIMHMPPPTEILGKELTITVTETEAPSGYSKCEGQYEFKVTFSKEKGLEISESPQSEYYEVRINDDNGQLEIDVKNAESELKDLELQIYKKSNEEEPLENAEFSLTIENLYSDGETLTTDSNGYTETITINKENLGPGDYKVKLEETTAPEGYTSIDEVNFTITIEENNTITTTSPASSLVDVSITSGDDAKKILITVTNNKEEEEEEEGDGEFPLIMTISGKVWLDQSEGKNSEADGIYDEGEELKGIIVTIYEEDGITLAKFADPEVIKDALKSDTAQKYMSDEIKAQLSSYTVPTNPTSTDANGEFEFAGLDPAKKYTIVFTYNGMRYSEIMASISQESGVTVTTTTAKAIEDETRRIELTQMFSEIGSYPNNYQNGLVFTQTEVENYIQTGTLPSGVNATQMEQFIKDTEITASISNIGGILEDIEDVLRDYNTGLGLEITEIKGIASNYVFPVVSKNYAGHATYNEYISGQRDSWYTNDFLNNYNSYTNVVGYTFEADSYVYMCTVIGYGAHSGHTQLYSYPKEVTNKGILEGMAEKTEIGDYKNPVNEQYFCYNHGYYYTNESTGTTAWVQTPKPTGTWKIYTFIPEKSEVTFYLYKVEEGYETSVQEDDTYHTRLAKFNTEDEPLFDYDEKSSNTGIVDKKWGWNNLTGKDDDDLKEKDGNEAIGKIYQYICDAIAENEYIKNQDLCVVYRPTVDLGLYDDVSKAIVTINSQTETYVYDKRQANGETFKFGVNEFDISTGTNTAETVWDAYEEYYSGLSEGKPDGGESTVPQEAYADIGIRKEDVVINTGEEGSTTTTGEAIAGNYNDYDVSIEMIYRIKIYNEASVTAHVTNILDYYMDTFTFDGVYADEECTTPIGEYSEYSEVSQEGYKVMNINLSSIELTGNSSYEIFIKLHMTDPKETLGGDVLDEGYTTWNYAEIGGYGTTIGVIDIDSTPGDLIPEERFDSGPYDDDESKSPTLTYKNPEDASRSISGIVYEDATGKLEMQSYVGETREGDGQYDAETDTPVIGAIVTLLETDANGTIVEKNNGIRAQTVTQADGTYKFDKIVSGYYIIKFEYGSNYTTVLTSYNDGKNSDGNDLNSKYSLEMDLSQIQNSRSYNGQDYENTTRAQVSSSYGQEYWYTAVTEAKSYAEDNQNRRYEVTRNFQTLNNEKSEILNSYKDKEPNEEYLNKLVDQTSMYAETDIMLLDVEYHLLYEDKIVYTNDNGTYDKTYKIENISFGIVERERAELEITKQVSYISIVDSTGKEITGGTYEDWKNGNIQYVKWIQGADGFVDMEIDTELLSGATLKITYEITVTNTSEAGNNISNIEVIDYVSNNLNYADDYGNNAIYGWTPITTDEVAEYVNNTSINSEDTSNQIDLSTYQTILKTTFTSLEPGNSETKTLTLEKNLSSEEESNFNYENQVEIVQTYNPTGRGDYSSIYGNLDPKTYTSKQGDLNWDYISTDNENGFTQRATITELEEAVSNINAMRLAEKDSGNAEEVIITPPTGTTELILQTKHYVLALTGLITLAAAIILTKKYILVHEE